MTQNQFLFSLVFKPIKNRLQIFHSSRCFTPSTGSHLRHNGGIFFIPGPTSSPVINVNAQNTHTSLNFTWKELPIMGRQGIITGYMIKWMKNCEYQRLMNYPEDDDCVRVPPENTTSFSVDVISSDLLYYNINGLTPFTWYRCEVCAKTSVGYGPCGNATFQTDESGKLLPLLPCVVLRHSRRKLGFSLKNKNMNRETSTLNVSLQINDSLLLLISI